MRLIFVSPSTAYPTGGVAVIYEYASAMARRGHQVHLFHIPLFDRSVSGLDDLAWFEFPAGVEHHFPDVVPTPPEQVPHADFIFGYSSEVPMPAHAGLPVVFIQGYRMLDEDKERHAFRSPCAKVCVAGWLVEVGLEYGVPERELVHIPPGLWHDRFRLERPIEDRPPRVAFCYNTHLQKGASLARNVVVELRRRRPELEVVMFGSEARSPELAPWIDYRADPPPRELVGDIYNGSRIFLCTSRVEGFGLPSVEAMACGAALVTVDNGGARDYAFHDRTALVSERGDAAALVRNLSALLADDERRVRLARAGCDFVKRFDWANSAEQMESFLEEYRADPAAFGYRQASG